MGYRIYGEPPHDIALIHGGPGAPGSLQPLARNLADQCGIIEPFQSAETIDDQIEELKEIITTAAKPPVTIVGHSWGAWLGYLFTAKYNNLVRKLILLSSGPYEDKYVEKMNKTRAERLSEEDKRRSDELVKSLFADNTKNRAEVFSEFGTLMSKVDSFAPVPAENTVLGFQPDVFRKIMAEVNEMRTSRELLYAGKGINCPVVAIHGEYDPHPYEGVQEPLERVLDDFQFVLLKRCGHTPWEERYARDMFYKTIIREIRKSKT